MTENNSKIALIHATPVAIDPIAAAFKKHWPACVTANILDDSLSVDRALDGVLTKAISERIEALANYALGLDVSAILYTCSAFGSAIDKVAHACTVPVLKPNEAMFEAALESGSSIGMLSTFQPSMAGMEEEFAEAARLLNSDARLVSLLVPDAMDALRNGDATTHNTLVAQQASHLGSVDAIMLAHFSTSRALEMVGEGTNVPVLSSPEAAVLKLKRLLG